MFAHITLEFALGLVVPDRMLAIAEASPRVSVTCQVSESRGGAETLNISREALDSRARTRACS